MKFIKYLGNILYSLILLFIVISGICNISTLLGRLGVGFGALNYILTISLTAFSFYMFARDINNVYKSKKETNNGRNNEKKRKK